MDKRWHQLAEILVSYSTGVRAGERVLVAMHETHTLPLVRAVYEQATRAGAHVQVQFTSEQLRHSLLRYGSTEQVSWVPEMEALGMEWADVYLGLRGDHNPFELADVPAEALAAHQRAIGAISRLRWQKTRWCLVRLPGSALAQQAEMDTAALTELFFSACLRNWRDEANAWNRIAHRLSEGSEVQLVAHETDLRFSTSGRKWIVGDGHINMPDGEIFTAPVHESVNGHITFEWPSRLGSRTVRGLRLEWQDGALVDCYASENADYMRSVLTSDPGASHIGEFAIGTNAGISRPCNEMLWDEKIGGTMHIALGRSYPQCGGTNESVIHWDVVKDTRSCAALYVDGHKVFEDGRFLL